MDLMNILTVRGASGHEIVVRWNEKQKFLSITGVTDEEIKLRAASITHQVESRGEVVWEGKNFSVLSDLDEYLGEEYPGVPRRDQYFAADSWCSKKGWKPKLAHRFLINWFKKAHGTGRASSGVVL